MKQKGSAAKQLSDDDDDDCHLSRAAQNKHNRKHSVRRPEARPGRGPRGLVRGYAVETPASGEDVIAEVSTSHRPSAGWPLARHWPPREWPLPGVICI